MAANSAKVARKLKKVTNEVSMQVDFIKVALLKTPYKKKRKNLLAKQIWIKKGVGLGSLVHYNLKKKKKIKSKHTLVQW